MKSAVISAIIVILIFVLVGINTAVVDGMIERTLEEVEPLKTAEEFFALSESYESRAKYINLTVSHVMMSEVEEAFAELEGAFLSGDEAGITEAKSRLADALGQLKRLAGLSFDSII